MSENEGSSIKGFKSLLTTISILTLLVTYGVISIEAKGAMSGFFFGITLTLVEPKLFSYFVMALIITIALLHGLSAGRNARKIWDEFYLDRSDLNDVLYVFLVEYIPIALAAWAVFMLIWK